MFVQKNLNGVNLDPFDFLSSFATFVSDNKKYLVVGTVRYNPILGTWRGHSQVFLNHGGLFTKVTGENNPLEEFIHLGQGPVSVASTDIDGDGREDLLFSTVRGPISISFDPDGGAIRNEIIIAEKSPETDLGVLRYLRQEPDGTFTEVLDDRLFQEITEEDTNTVLYPTFVRNLFGQGKQYLVTGRSDGTLRTYVRDGDTFTRLTEDPLGNINVGADANPNFIDLDNDGHLELFVGADDGTISYYENDGNGNFSQITGPSNPFDGIDVGTDASLHFNDVDNDGDLDLFVGENAGGQFNYFENLTINNNKPPVALDDSAITIPGGAVTINVLENDTELEGEPILLQTWDATTALGGTVTRDDQGTPNDLTDDQLVYTPPSNFSSPDSFTYTISDSNGNTANATVTVKPVTFVERIGSDNPFNAIDIGNNSAPALVDFDHDGDLDLFTINSSGVINFYRNENDNFVSDESNNPFAGFDIDGQAINFGDLDGDGDLDALVSNYYGRSSYYLNDGGTFIKQHSSDAPIEFFYAVDAAIIDQNGDGLLDLVVGSRFGGTLRYFQGLGGGNFEEMLEDENPFINLNIEVSIGRPEASPAFVDFDNDGDKDVLVGTSLGQIKAYRNDENNQWTELTGTEHPFGENIDVGRRAKLDVGDIDGDGDLEVVAGSNNGKIYFWENGTINNGSKSPPDDRYEENDTLATAYDLSNQEKTWLSTINGAGIQADTDWYQIDVTPGYENLVVDLQFAHAEGDIDLAVYDVSGNLVTGSTSVTDNEYINAILPDSGVYYLEVSYGNAGNTYDLWWDDLLASDA
ncbi:MAG: FG-GAP-like repeat-containing protein [Xenococcaceae cyanobacterium MO_167.B52]|nr:FG-GAP-like repeat-containing protein [Xenococcaceae cyanobacterium MO_167.B52]